MDVSPNALRKETVATLREVEAVITSIKEEAQLLGKKPEHLLDKNENWVMVPLLLAKSQCLSTLTQLNEQGKRK